MHTFIEILRSGGSIICNKRLAQNIGLQEAIFYSELLSKYLYFEGKDQLDKHGYFFNTVENMQQDTTLSDSQQRKIIKKLVKLGLIQYHRHGIPAKRYFKIVMNQKLLEKYSNKKEENSPSSEEIKELDLKKIDISSENTKGTDTKKVKNIVLKKVQSNNTKNNTKYNNTKKEVTSSSFENININTKEEDSINISKLRSIKDTFDNKTKIQKDWFKQKIKNPSSATFEEVKLLVKEMCKKDPVYNVFHLITSTLLDYDKSRYKQMSTFMTKYDTNVKKILSRFVEDEVEPVKYTEWFLKKMKKKSTKWYNWKYFSADSFVMEYKDSKVKDKKHEDEWDSLSREEQMEELRRFRRERQERLKNKNW